MVVLVAGLEVMLDRPGVGLQVGLGLVVPVWVFCLTSNSVMDWKFGRVLLLLNLLGCLSGLGLSLLAGGWLSGLVGGLVGCLPLLAGSVFGWEPLDRDEHGVLPSLGARILENGDIWCAFAVCSPAGLIGSGWADGAFFGCAVVGGAGLAGLVVKHVSARLSQSPPKETPVALCGLLYAASLLVLAWQLFI